MSRVQGVNCRGLENSLSHIANTDRMGNAGRRVANTPDVRSVVKRPFRVRILLVPSETADDTAKANPSSVDKRVFCCSFRIGLKKVGAGGDSSSAALYFSQVHPDLGA